MADPTPDLEELERDVSLAGAHYAHHDPEGRAGLACKACHAATRVRNALPALLRAARERDELRAKVKRFVGGEAGDKMERRARTISDALGIADESTTKQVESINALRARAEKAEARSRELEGLYARQCALTDLKDDRAARAEARAKELEAAASPLLEFLRTLPEDALGRDAELGFAYRDQAIDSLERALAQKEPR